MLQLSMALGSEDRALNGAMCLCRYAKALEVLSGVEIKIKAGPDCAF